MLNKVLIIKQNFLIKLKNGTSKEISIENRRYYFFNTWLILKLTKIDKKSYKNIDIYYIGYITIKKISDYENFHSVNPLYLITGEVDGHVEEKMGVNI